LTRTCLALCCVSSNPAHQVKTVAELGLAGTTNGALLANTEGNFDVFLTADKNLRYQQNLRGRSLAIVELPTNRLPILRTMTAEIASAVVSAAPGYVHSTRLASAAALTAWIGTITGT